MAELRQLETALRNADAAGDVEAARILAGEIIRTRGSGVETSKPKTEISAGGLYKALDAGVGSAVAGIGGLPGDALDLMAKGLEAATNFTTDKLGVKRAQAKADPDSMISKVVNAIPRQATMQKEIQDSLYGGEKPYEPQNRTEKYVKNIGEFAPAAMLGPGGIIRKALTQAVIPAVASEAAGQYTEGTKAEPYARIAAALAAPLGVGALGMAAAPLTSRIAPQFFTDQKMAQVLRRSGMDADEVAGAMRSASADAQPMFTAADAMGNAGQRALSGVTRQPHDMRQPIVDMLETRQAGQGRRIANSLSEAFNAPDTAAARASKLISERTAAADVNYGAARGSAGSVNVTPAIDKADAFISPGASSVFKPSTQITDNSIASAVSKAKGYLTDGKSQVSDFDTAFRAKREIDSLIEGATKAQQKELIPIRNALDDALAASSKPYAAARDTFKSQSKAIDAVDLGTIAAKRGRFEDTIPQFEKMTPDRQAAFRAGYADPLIEQTQGSAFGANKARPLINDATAAEFPAFSAPGQAEQLQRRIGRENTMYETRNQALGGSRTADNLADAGDVTKLDPRAIVNLLSGNFGNAASGIVGRALSEVQGMTPRVSERLAKILIETNPEVLKSTLEKAMRSSGGAPLIARLLARGSLAHEPVTVNQGR